MLQMWVLRHQPRTELQESNITTLHWDPDRPVGVNFVKITCRLYIYFITIAAGASVKDKIFLSFSLSFQISSRHRINLRLSLLV